MAEGAVAMLLLLLLFGRNGTAVRPNFFFPSAASTTGASLVSMRCAGDEKSPSKKLPSHSLTKMREWSSSQLLRDKSMSVADCGGEEDGNIDDKEDPRRNATSSGKAIRTKQPWQQTPLRPISGNFCSGGEFEQLTEVEEDEDEDEDEDDDEEDDDEENAADSEETILDEDDVGGGEGEDDGGGAK